MYLSLAGLFEAIYYAQNDFKQFDPLFEKFEVLCASHPDVSAQEIEVRLFSAMIRAMFYRCPEHPRAPAWLQRGMDLWERTADEKTSYSTGCQPQRSVPLVCRCAQGRCHARSARALVPSYRA